MKNKYWLHILLFLLTLVSTTLSGAEWMTGRSILADYKSFGIAGILEGWKFSVPFLAFLTFHEFGHFFAAKIKRINVSLPYYLPAWFGVLMSIGTFGAFIRIRDFIKTKNDYFDIAIAGPLAGFVVSVFCLILGFSSIKSDEYIHKIHPEYKLLKDYRVALDKIETNPNAIVLGESILFKTIKETFSEPQFRPHKYEMSHYPLILAGFLGLIFTAINLLPIGQLDGGHILFAMIGKKYFDILSPTFLVLLTFYGGLGTYTAFDFRGINADEGMSFFLYFGLYVYFVYLVFSKIFDNKLNNFILALAVIVLQLLSTQFFPGITGYSGILAFCFLLGRFLGVYHPEVEDPKPLDMGRMILGVLAMIIFVLCISLQPIS